MVITESIHCLNQKMLLHIHSLKKLESCAYIEIEPKLVMCFHHIVVQCKPRDTETVEEQ